MPKGRLKGLPPSLRGCVSSQGAAFFDVDGTIVRGDIVRYYVYLRTTRMTMLHRALWSALFLFKVPCYIALDRLSRRTFSRVFYRNYVNLSPTELQTRAPRHFQQAMSKKMYPGALERLHQHQQNGEPVVLVTNSLWEIMVPLAEHLQASELIAVRLEEKGGAFTGELVDGPLTDKRKAEGVVAFARKHGLDLDQCYAYADSLDDVPMLESVGHPKAVNPDRGLRQIARRKGWETLSWQLDKNSLPAT